MTFPAKNATLLKYEAVFRGSPMKKTRDKTEFHDWLLINTLKYQGDDSVPEGIHVDVEQREAVHNNPEAKLNLLAEVARKKFSVWTISAFNAAFGMSVFIVAAFLLWIYWMLSGGVLSGSTKTGDNTYVNVGPFLLFLIPQYIFLLVTLALTLFIVLVQPLLIKAYKMAARFLGYSGKNAHRPYPLFFSVLLYLSSLIGTIVFALQWGGIKSVSFLITTISREKEKTFPLEGLFALFRDKPQLRGAIAGILTNSLWALFALCIVGAFWAQSFSHENHFYWKATYPKMQNRSWWVEQIDDAMKLAPWYDPLTKDEIQNVVNRKEPLLEAPTPDEEKARRTESEKWTNFIISSFLAAVIIRALLGGIHFWLYRLYKKDFKPQPEDEFFRTLIEKIVGSSIVNTEDQRSEDTASLPPVPVPLKPPVQASGPPKTLIFMYDLHVPEVVWQEFFPDRSRREVYGVAECRDEQGEEIQQKINEGEVAIDKMVIAFDITEVPAGGKLKFVRDTAGRVMDKTYILLSRLEALRRQKAGDHRAIENRKMEWTGKLERIGIASGHIIDYYDHEIDDTKTRKRLAEFFRGNQESFHLAGKYAEASKIILAGVHELFEEYAKNPLTFASESWDARPVLDERFVQYREKITMLYTEEHKKLHDFIDRLASKIDVNEIKEAAAGKMQQLGDKTLRESFAWARWLSDVHRTLKPRCGLALVGIIPAAAVGITLGTAAAALAGPLAALGIAGAAGGFFTPETISQLKKGIFRQEFLKTSAAGLSASEMSDTDTNFRVEVSTFIVSLGTWAAVLELQGLPPEQIAERLPLVLEPIETTPVDSLETIRKVFEESQRILEND